VIEATGTEDKIDSLVEVLRPYGVSEMVRTGLVAMARGTGAVAAASGARASHVAADAQDNLGSYSV
jgi:acetolactate synthase-1/3 small subunit